MPNPAPTVVQASSPAVSQNRAPPSVGNWGRVVSQLIAHELAVPITDRTRAKTRPKARSWRSGSYGVAAAADQVFRPAARLAIAPTVAMVRAVFSAFIWPTRPLVAVPTRSPSTRLTLRPRQSQTAVRRAQGAGPPRVRRGPRPGPVPGGG